MSCTTANIAIADEQTVTEGPPAEAGRGILLVEDEPLVREVTAEVLTAAGYNVWKACNAAEALALFRRHREHIELLITDVKLPDRSGPSLAEKLYALGGDFSTILTSGYPESWVLKAETNLREFTYLAKPFSAELLQQKVREVLQYERCL